VKQKSAWCPRCERQVYAIGKAPNHILHLLLSLLTGTLWFWFVWLPLLVGTIGNYRCTKCGSRVQSVRGPVHQTGRGRDDDYDDEEEDERPRKRRRRSDD
jgi:hypothetical protein